MEGRHGGEHTNGDWQSYQKGNVGMHLTPVTTRCSILGYGGRLPTNFDGA